ncbi:MAG: transporter [Acidocella sp. 20-63-7]|nr:MAG: transporter [Acidocella sp. 20-63-7]
MTGHGLGVTGATTSVTAVGTAALVPGDIVRGDYLDAYVRYGLNHWIVWEVIGIAIGALCGSLLGRRFAQQIDGPPRMASMGRLLLALFGGGISGFGARLSMGCTSGMGLSGSAPLAAAGFLFLVGFFAAGAGVGAALKPLWKNGDAS